MTPAVSFIALQGEVNTPAWRSCLEALGGELLLGEDGPAAPVQNDVVRTVAVDLSQGAPLARHELVAQARGDWLVFLQPGDAPAPQTPTVLQQLTGEGGVEGFLFPAAAPEGEEWGQPQGVLRQLFLQGPQCWPGAVLVRREVYETSGGLDPRLFALGLAHWQVRLLRHLPVAVVSEPLLQRPAPAWENEALWQDDQKLREVEALVFYQAFLNWQEPLPLLQTFEEAAGLLPSRGLFERRYTPVMGDYVVARLAGLLPHPGAQLFAFRTLHALMGDAQNRDTFERVFQFSNRDYHRWCETLDVFGLFTPPRGP